MIALVACVVCAPPLDSRLTGGLLAGVLVLTVVALVVMAGLGRGAVRLLREDAARKREDAHASVVESARSQP